ncbi:uncharacterized protein [Dysidea avara]|uniref:uncharacterized protein n=1 Tax=Dysidea avara TaxID=196820 RepID=UPI00332CF5A8
MSVKQFSWETVWLEFERRLPTLVGLLQLILPSSSKAVLCFIIGIILKNRSPHMALIQRAVSVMLYAHGAGKQVYKSLQPLMVCLSHKRTIALVNRLSEDHDADVLFWAEDLKRFIEEQPVHHDILIAGDEIDMDQFESPAQDEDFVIDSNPINSSSSTSSSDDDVPTDDSESSVMGSPIDRSYTVQETSMSELEASFIPPPHSPIRLSDEDCTSPRQTEEVYPTAAENSVDQQMVTNYTLRDVPANDITCTPTLNPGNQSHWSGFKIVIDNVDKNFRPRYQRVDHQTKSLHCVHMYASKDRIDFSSFSNSKPEQVSVTPEDILPNYSDFSGIKEHFKVLVSRVLVQRLEQFSSQKRDVQWHLPSAYSNEMSMKSTVVPLGIIDQNENRVDEMAEILDQLHKYVPAKSYEVTTHLIDEGEELVHRGYNFHQIACTGDQLTVARQRTAKAVRHHSEDELDRLEGLVPSVEDWHTKQLLVKVIWKWLYSKQSSTEIGTLYQLKNTINRTNVPSDPKDNLNACEDFLGVVLEAHIVAAAKTLLSSTEYESVFGLAASIVDSFLQIDLPNTQPSQTQQPGRSRRRGTRQQPVPVDGVHIYGTDVLTLGLLWLGFSDAIKEGDGDKVFVYWKFLLLVFKSGGCRNYSIEAVKLLYQTHTLSPRLAAQLKWGRFINTHGRQGCNISGDLYLEHLNNRLKGTLCNLGPNNKTDTIQRAAKTVGVVSKVCQQFEKETCTVKDSDNHKRKPYTQDFNLILAILEEKDVFSNKPNRAHKSFALTQGHMQGFNDDKIHKWLQDKIESVKKYY